MNCNCSNFSGVCDFTRQCNELKKFLDEKFPNSANVNCKMGRRGSFEVTINDYLIHSKLQTIAFPVYEDVAENVQNAIEGKELKIVQQQKITDCCIQ